MKEYSIKNRYGHFKIFIFDDGCCSISGDIKATQHEFKQIHKKPPNRYGNFFKREKAGAEACKMIIAKYYNN